MGSERRDRVEPIYQSVAGCPVAVRAAVLNEACNNDPDLRKEVESLLNARDQAGLFLSPQHLQRHVAALADEPELSAGHKLGKYEIVSFLSSGALAKSISGAIRGSTGEWP